MNVLGLDLNTKRVAVASTEGWVELSFLDSMSTNPPLAALDLVRAYARGWGEPGVAWVEKAVVGINASSTIKQVYVAGPIMAYLGYLGWDVRLVNISTWKAYSVQNGGASKQEIEAYLTEHRPEYTAAVWEAEPRSKERRQDLFDAVGIMLYGQDHS